MGVVMLMLSVNAARAQQTLVVFAAASLTDAYEAIGTAFEAANPDVEVLFNFAGSSTLAAQLDQGAPADVFASANPQQMTAAIESGRIVEPVQTFARNRLVLIVPADNPANIQSLDDLANPDLRLILAAPAVPVRTYIHALLARLVDEPAYGTAYRDAVLNNVVSEEPNVRQATAKVVLGEADASIVYQSDVTPDIANDVLIFAIPNTLNTIATYPIAITDNTDRPELARDFIDFVLSDTGQDILTAWGFITVRIPPLPDTLTVPTDGTLRVDGQVLAPLTLTADALREDFTARQKDAYTGVLLWDLINAAQPNLDVTVPDDELSMFIVITGAAGDQVVVAWAEIDPTLGNQPVMIAYADADGQPLPDGPQLIVPTDRRHVRNVANISLRDAPRW